MCVVCTNSGTGEHSNMHILDAAPWEGNVSVTVPWLMLGCNIQIW